MLGSPLTIDLPAEVNAPEFGVRISYQTRPEASGLQWVAAPQTADKTDPFLFTQSQAIHARSWIPLQDSPQVRMTYRGDHPRAARHARGHERRQCQPSLSADRRLPVRHAAGDSLVSDRARRRQARVPRHRPAHRRVRRKLASSRPRPSEFAETEQMIAGQRETVRPVSLGPLRPADPAAVVSVRRHGESAALLHHADGDRRRPQPDRAHRARARAFLVRQPRHQRHLARPVAQRRFHGVSAGPHHAGGVRRPSRGDGRDARPQHAAERAGHACRRPTRCSRSTCAAAIRTTCSRRCPTSRARCSSPG